MIVGRARQTYIGGGVVLSARGSDASQIKSFNKGQQDESATGTRKFIDILFRVLEQDESRINTGIASEDL
jgi:hypothetical protein